MSTDRLQGGRVARSRYLVYCSKAKVAANRPERIRGVVASGNLKASAGLVSGGLNLERNANEIVQFNRDFERIRRSIARQAKSMRDPSLGLLEWFYFDEPLAYGTACEDSATPEVASDVALFAGDVTAGPQAGSRPTQLLLCGSACHLLDRSWESAGRMGSSTGWLYDLIKEIDRLDGEGVRDSGGIVRDPALRRGRSLAPAEVARVVYQVFADWHPRRQRAQLAGVAQLLLDLDDDEWPTRLLVGTPLYVQGPGGPSPCR
ncbi:SAVMC3_10250 family protein [Actinomadura nitritigenes]|uniref:SAVMC3_10250 family protein n=1 Tax=Actinomadura nitritigenes TaxID=134602 RepID=UPI003D8E77DC